MSPNLEMAVRFGAFAAMFGLLALWEAWRPRRRPAVGRPRRWFGNLGILALDVLAVRLLVPASAFAVALLAGSRGWGLFNIVGLPPWVAVISGVVALDLVIYAQHYVFHHVPLLWRVHRMHHADLELDVTTGLRFHPIEILLSLLIKMAAVAALGVPPLAVLIFEVLLNVTAMFNHSNVALPSWLEPVARWVVVTPQMHQVHHSVVRAETDSNFGFNLPWWDRLFGTYKKEPAAGEQGMTIGLPVFRAAAELGIVRLLTQPFRDDRA